MCLRREVSTRGGYCVVFIIGRDICDMPNPLKIIDFFHAKPLLLFAPPWLVSRDFRQSKANIVKIEGAHYFWGLARRVSARRLVAGLFFFRQDKRLALFAFASCLVLSFGSPTFIALNIFSRNRKRSKILESPPSSCLLGAADLTGVFTFSQIVR